MYFIRTNTVAICTRAPLPCLVITMNIIQLVKVYVGAIQNIKTVC